MILKLKIDSDGTREWFLNGKLHRNDGPAVEYVDGTKKWYMYGNLHREDGPAIEYPNGGIKWWLNGYGYTLRAFLKKVNLTPEEKTMLLLNYS